MNRTWIRRLFSRPVNQVRKAPRRCNLNVEALEDRTAPATFTVLNTNDTGAGSLRNAVAQANANLGADTILFDNTVFNTPQTIVLTSGAITFAGDTALTTVTGPGANLLSVSGGNTQGVWWVNSGISASISGMTVTQGRSGVGAVYNAGTLTLSDCTVTGNASTAAGGGVSNAGTLTMTNVTISASTAVTKGGALDNRSSATATLTDCTISGNTVTGANGGGGGLSNLGALTLTRCTVSGNSVTGSFSSSGGINTQGAAATLIAIDTTISGNTATDFGGGMSANGTVSLTNCTISGNTATVGGGGINSYTANTTMVNCTVSGNQTGASGTGGGVFVHFGSVSLKNVTVSDNTALSGGGIYHTANGTLTVGNTIVSGNTATTSPDVFGTINTDNGHNLFGAALSGTTSGTGNVFSDTPGLGALANNGGPTQTMALLSGSAAIDAGSNALIPGGVTTDQRGLARIINGTVDIGAFEIQSLTFTVTNANDSGAGSLRQAILDANAAPTADTIVFSSLFNSAQTITLTSGVLTFTGAATTTIQAPASNLLSVSGANTQQVFQVNSGASAALSGLTITAGRIASGNGGGVVNNGTLVLTDCSVSGNAAPSGAGGGIVNSGTATLIHSSVTNNTARGYGGGIRNAGTLTMTDCTVSGNTTTIQSGGGMYNTGTTTLVSCTVSSNTSANRGGGMSDTGGTTTLLNCTITGNFAQVNGGGVNSNNNAGPGSTTLTNCTVSGNSTAGSGGGLSVINNQIILRNTIVAGNTASGSGPDAFQTIVSSGNNLIGKTNGSTGWIASDLQGTIAAPLNPMLAALSDNGGLTRTMALLPGSPAIDAGANSFVASEAQAVTIIGSAGSFTLTFNGQTTTSILFNASAAAVQSALGLLSTIGGVGGSVTVTKSGSVYTVTFGGALAQENLPQMTASGTGGAIATVATVVNGATDQRGVLRTVNGVVDIGAFEWTAPTVAADTASVSASEGSSVTNTGTFHDENGNNTVLLTASIGTVIQHNGSGTWSWSLGVNDGPVGPFTVTITATDNFGATAVALFSYSGANVTPVAAITGPSTGVRNQPLTYRLTATDPGALDQAAGVTYQVYWDFVNNPGTFETIAPTPYNGAGLDVSHVYSQTGTFNIHVVAVDKDADSDTADLAGSVVITASALIENTLLVGSTGNDITVDPNNVTFGANIVAIGNANAVQVYTQTGVSQIDATTAAVPVSVVINDAFTGALTVKTAQTDNTIAIAPTSTAAITIVDGGGRNTLDFSTATTSSAPQGVTLNLNTVNQAQPINAQGGTINIHGKIQTVITSPNAASTIIAALPTVDTASQSVSGGTTVVAKGQDAVFTTLKTTVQAGSDSAIIGLMDRATFDAAVASLTDGQTGDVVSGPSKAFLQNAFATAVSIGFDDALIAAFDSELLAGFDAGQLTNLRNQITLQGTGATALVGLLTNVRATSVSKNTVVTVFDATAKALVSRGLANFEDQLSGGFSGAVRSAFDDSLTAGFEDLVAAGFEDELAGGFVSPTGVRLLQKAFDDVVSGGFEDDLAAGFDDGLAAGFSGGLTQAQRDFADDLLAGFQDDLAAGFESQLKAHFDDALEAGYRAILARGFDDSVAGGFDDALAAGFEDALAAGFDDALQGAFDDALQAAFDDAVDAGYDAAQARAFEDALAAGFTRMRSAAHFDDNLAAGFQDVLLAGFTQAMTTQFSAKLNSRFDDVLAGGFNDDLNAGFDDTLNAGFLVLKTGTNSAGNKFADELSAGFATDPAALNKFDDVLSSGFDDILEGGFEAALAGGFEDELTAAFGGDLTSVVKAFEDDLAAGFTIHLSTHFDDALAAGFDDALAGGFDDILAGGFEDALSSGFQQALRARFDDALAAGFDDALAAAFAAAAHPLTAAQSRAFEDALQAGFDDILAGGFDDALAAGFRDQLQSRFEDALAAGFRAQMLARFSATVPANFEDALNAGFQNLQSAGFEDALAGGFEDEIAAGFQTSVKSAFAANAAAKLRLAGFDDTVIAGFEEDLATGFDDALGAGFDDALQSAFSPTAVHASLRNAFDDLLASGFDDVLASGFQTALAQRFAARLGAQFDDTLVAAFDDALEAAFNQLPASARTALGSALRFDAVLAAGFDDILSGGFSDDLAAGFRNTLGTRFDDALSSGFGDLVAAGFNDALASGFEDEIAAGFDDTLSGGFEDALAGGFEDSLVAAFGVGVTTPGQTGKSFADDLAAGFQDDLAAGFERSVRAGFDDALQSAFEDVLAGGFEDVLAGGFEDALAAGFQQRMQARFDDAIDAGFQSAVRRAYDDALAGGYQATATLQQFEDEVQAGFDDILDGGFRARLLARFEDDVAAGFGRALSRSFADELSAGFDDGLNAAFHALLSATNTAGKSFSDELAAGFESDLSAGFEGPLAAGFKSTLAGRFEDTLAGGFLSGAALSSFEDDLAGGFEEALVAGFEDDVQAGFDDALAAGFDDILAGGFEDALASGFQKAVKARFDDALDAGFTNALAHLDPALRSGVSANFNTIRAQFEDALSAGFEDEIAAGFVAALKRGFEDELSAGFTGANAGRFEDALNAGLEALKAAGFEDALAAGFEGDLAAGFKSTLPAGFDDSLAGGFKNALPATFQSILPAGVMTSTQLARFEDDLVAGFEDDLAGGFEGALIAGFDDALQAGFDEAVAAGFDDIVSGGFDDTVAAGFQASVRGRFATALEAGFQEALGKAYDNALEAGFSAPQATQLQGALSAAFSALRGGISSAAFNVDLATGLRTALASHRFEDTLAGGFQRVLGGNFDNLLRAGFDDMMEAGFAAKLGAQFDDALTGGFVGILRTGFEDELAAGFNGQGTDRQFEDDLIAGFEDELAAGFEDALAGGFDDALEAGFEDLLSAGFDDVLSGGFEDALSAGFAKALKTRFQDALDAGLTQALSGLNGTPAQITLLTNNFDGLRARFGDALAGGFDDVLDAGFRRALAQPATGTTTFHDLLVSKFRTQSATQLAVAQNAQLLATTVATGILNAFRSNITVTGGNNTVKAGILANVTLTGGDNLFVSSVSVSAQSLVSAVLTAFQTSDATSLLSSFRTNVTLQGENNTAQAGFFTNVTLPDGSGLVVQQLTPTQLGLLQAALDGVGPEGRAAALSAATLSVTMADGANTFVGGVLSDFTGGAGADQFLILDPTLLGVSPTYLSNPANAAFLASLPGGTFSGGKGNDTYTFVGGLSFGFNTVTIDEAAPTPTDDGGNDTLDFSSYQGGGVTLNLASAAPQTSYLGSTTTPRLAIQLSSGSGIENVVGSPAVDHITGNARANVFEGADITVDRISQSPAPAWNGRTQVVYLQFLPAGASRTPFSVANPDQVHTYTLDEEIAIAQQIEQDYAAFTVPTHKDGNGAAITTLIDGTRPDQAGYLPYFRFYIVDATGQVRDDSGVAVASVTDPFTGHSLPTHFTNLFLAPVDYTVVRFNDSPTDSGAPRPGGHSDDVDLRNTVNNSIVQVDINGFLGGPGQPADDTLTQPDASQRNAVKMSATLAAHEVGHSVGLVHSDALGPIGAGTHMPPGVSKYLPIYGGVVQAFETTEHLMASPASVGSSLFDTINDPSFGERELVKLAIDAEWSSADFKTETGLAANVVHQTFTIDPTTNPVDAIAVNTPVTLANHAVTLVGDLQPLSVPNTMTTGVNAGKVFDVAALVIQGHIDATNEPAVDPLTGAPVTDAAGDPLYRSGSDFYAFTGRAGDLINLEALSVGMNRFGTDAIDPLVRVYGPDGRLITAGAGVAVNDDDFDGGIANIVDLRLPEYAAYANASGDYTFYVQVDTFSFQNNPNFSAAAIAKYAARNADGSLVDPSRADGLYHTDTGAYELLIYRFNARNASAGADHLGSTATLNVGTVFGDAVTVTVDGAWANVNGQTVQPSPGPVNLLIDAGTNHALQLSGTVVNGVATFDVKAAGAGPHTFQAIYQGDTILDGSTSAITTASVAPAPASASLNAPTITYGAHAQVTVSLSSSVAMPQGDVTLTVDGVIFATQTLSGGVTTFDVGALNAGAHAMSARFTALHGNYTASDVSGTLTVNQRAVTVTADAKTKLYGAVDPVLTYHITSGSLAMGDGFSGALTRQAGEALGSYAILQGTLALSANYALQYVGATFTITGATTATALVASSGTHYFGQSVTFTANVTADSGAAAVGSVDFFDITTGVDLGVVNVASGSASLTISSLVAGAHAIRATFTGAVGFVGSSASTNVAIVGDSIVVLNQTMAGALSISGNGHVQVDGIVDVESSSASAISASGNAIIGAAAVRTAGAFSRSGNAQINPPATTHAARLGDPLAGLAAPSIAGLVNRGSLSIGGNTTQTINPGIYTQISLSGNAKVTLNPGVYVIAGGGFTVTGNAAVTGAGIFIYNAGSNYANNGAPGGTFGGLTLGGAGKIDLAPAGAGVYAGILVYQARDNTRALSLSGNGTLLHGGLLYVPAGLVTESGSGQLQASIVANQVQVSGNAYNTLTDEGTESTSFTAGQLLAGDLVVYLDNEAGAFTPEEIARIEDAISVINVVINPFNVHIIEVGAADRDLATLVIHSAETSAVGGALDGVLGCEGAGLITVVQGWNWYAGADTNAVGPDQFDFETIVMHELGHALGLGHSEDTSSVMYATLATGEARRSLTVADLAIPDLDDGPCGLHVAGMGQRDEARGRSADASGGAFGLTAVAPDVVQAAASFASGLAPTEIVSAQVVHGTSATILSAPVPSAMAIAASETTLAAQSTAWQTGAGADVLIGGAGADLLLGETGSAMLLGGFGGSEQAPEQHQKQATNAESETNGVTRIESAVDVGGAHSDTLTTALGAWLDDASGLDQQIGADSQGDWLDVSCLALLGAIPALLACDGGVERRSRLLSGVANSLTPREPLG